MEKSRESDILFCNLCGTMLVLKSTKYAECPLCETTRNGKEIIDKNLAYTVTTEKRTRNIRVKKHRKTLSYQRFLRKSDSKNHIKKACEKCQHPELVYTTRQTRSADEGQTTYYTCPNCGHRFTEG
ncbi:putative Zinc finger, TFIIS-type, DNA-directed RNA polymerase subunit/transcription factor S [Arabidopsis thaliana]